jgi:hypothetical protein
LEGTVEFVGKHLEKFQLFDSAIRDAMRRGFEQGLSKQAESYAKSRTNI